MYHGSNSMRALNQGQTVTLILSVLRDGPMHGYGIAREIQRRSESALQFGEGTLYPALRAMENDGLVQGNWQTPPRGPARKEYTLTEKGIRELEKRVQEWKRLTAAVDAVIGGTANATAT